MVRNTIFPWLDATATNILDAVDFSNFDTRNYFLSSYLHNWLWGLLSVAVVFACYGFLNAGLTLNILQ